MPRILHSVKRLCDELCPRLDHFLHLFSTYAAPLLIGLASLFAVFYWTTHDGESNPVRLDIHVFDGADDSLRPAQALSHLNGGPGQPYFETRLSEKPFWFSFSIAPYPPRPASVIELPSRHTVGIECWDATALTSLGSGNRSTTTGEISEVKAGFKLELGKVGQDGRVICRANAIGPAIISAIQWDASELLSSDQQYHRQSGLLNGGILILAAFLLITAYINRNPLYLLFSAWLVVNLRMAALSAGWDMQWLGVDVPLDWVTRLRSITTSIYYVLSITLFKALFSDELSQVGSRWLLRVAQWTCIPLVILSIFLSYHAYLPFLWVSTGLIIGTMIFFLTRILVLTPSRVAIWYGASVGIALIASLSEVLSAALGFRTLTGSVNSVTAALSSSLLAALAVAEHMRQEHEQRLALQAELEHTYNAMPIGLFTLDLSGRFLSANPALKNMLGPLVVADSGNTWSRHFSPDDWNHLLQMVSSGGQDEIEIKGRKLPGFIDTKRFLVKATLARGKIEGSLQDVTEKSRATEHLLFLANHDPLTKAYNRRGIDTLLTSAIGELRSGKQSTISAAYLDLDRFKLINDLFGHDAGDEVLRQVCGRVSTQLDEGQSFGRVGGDEFVIIFPGVPIAKAASICNSIVESLGATPYLVGEKAFYVRGSIGLVEVSSDMQFNDVMSSTDRACREAKASNGGALVVNERNSAAFLKHEAELNLIALLSRPAATEGFHLEMQPIMSLTAPHQSLNFEVLLRMRDPLGNPVRTDLLIQAAENCGRMGMIDRWVLTTTVQWLETHFSEMQHTKFVCVNLSGASLNDEAFLNDVYALFESKPDLVRYLCLEVTESVALHDLANTRRFVDRIRGYGAKVALDDFGAGYTSFSYLKEFSADLLKIDGSFIVNMNQHPANIAIVEAIVSLAKNLGMKVVAEWAEDLDTMKTLTEIGVDYVQGFIVARPQHPDQLLLARSSASFIKDADVAQYATRQEKLNTQNPTADLFSTIVDNPLH